jgi:NADH:ubiquinone oxidoreductase subunit H
VLFVCVFFSLFFFGFWNEFSSGRLELKGSVCVCVFFLFFFFLVLLMHVFIIREETDSREKVVDISELSMSGW